MRVVSWRDNPDSVGDTSQRPVRTCRTPVFRPLSSVLCPLSSVLCPLSSVLYLLLLAAPPLQAQSDAPFLNRPARMVDQVNWFHARGGKVRVAWNVAPVSIPEDGELTATLIITGADNPRQIVRPDLKKQPEFGTRFVIIDNADPKPAEAAPAVSFSYRLRPRNRSVNKVPRARVLLLQSGCAERSQFKSTTAKAVDITVTEAPRREPPPVPLTDPDYLFVIATGPQVLSSDPFLLGWWVWLAVGLAGPLAAGTWYAVWRRFFPGAAQLALRRRSRAARRALAAIRKSSRALDPPAAIEAAVLTYLRSHLPLPLAAATPGEIEVALAELGVSEPDRIAAGGFFRDCDAVRFSPGSLGNETLLAEAIALIARLEAIPEPLGSPTRAVP